MQATGLLPGLYEVLGTHFGKAGYRVGGVAALAAAVLIILSPAALLLSQLHPLRSESTWIPGVAHQ